MFRYVMITYRSESGRWILWIPVFLATGIGVYFSLPSEPALWHGAFASLVFGLLVWGTRNCVGLFHVLMACLAFAVGFSSATWRTATLDHVVLEKQFGPAVVTGKVQKTEIFPANIRVTLEQTRVRGLAAHRTPNIVRVRIAGKTEPPLPGTWISVRSTLRPPPPPTAPGAFDFQRHFYFQKIGATGFSLGGLKVEEAPRDAIGFRSVLASLRQDLTTHIRDAIGGSAGAVSAALMTGDRSGIPETVLENYRASGLAHLLAISGLHVGMIAAIIFFSLRYILALIPQLALNYPIKKFAAGGAIAGAFAYALIAGATIPTQRAFIMVALMFLGVIFDRQGISMRLVAWAATVILVFQPEALLSASFQLSFAAVIALVASYEVWTVRRSDGAMLPRRHILFRYISGIGLTTIIAGTATAPFALFHFNRVALLSTIANLLAVPLMGLVVMPLAILAFVLMPFGLDGPALTIMGWGVAGLNWIAAKFSALPAASWFLPSMSVSGLIILSLGGIWLCLWRQRWRYAGVAAVLVGIFTPFLTTTPDVLVSENAKLFAVKSGEGVLYLSSKSVSRFTGETWLRRAGINPSDGIAYRSRSGRMRSTGLNGNCDQLGCIFLLKGETIALVTGAQALPEDCRRASMVVSAEPVPWACESAHLVIDRYDVWRNGAHAIWLEDGGIKVETANDRRGNRPWVLRPAD